MNLAAENLQIEQELERQRQEFLLNEQNQAVTFMLLCSTADTMAKGGVTITMDTLADYANLFLDDVQSSISWFRRGPSAKLPFELDSENEAESKLDKLIAALTWIANRKLCRTKGRKVPPLDRSCLGVQKVMQLTGLGRVEILELVATHQETLVQRWDDFKMSWVEDDQSVIQKNNKNQHTETKIKLIRAAIEEIAKGRIGMVTGEMLEGWQNNKIGLNKRQIDRILSDNPSMRDLDKYRARGRQVGGTLADREAAYLKQLYS